ncbi:hypothetical protein ACHFJ0_16000 [Paracoccus sp. NGMCC 1.201697]|uniref:Uncharacterized protein n=1 Tax=Paracoccus broussonetiae subsp. drimophilus TaxID=3373869 RepID=A0ABW7LNP7_9RHOB
MRKAGAILLIIASLAFVASGLGYALQPVSPPVAAALPSPLRSDAGLDELLEPTAAAPDLATQLLRPRIPAMAALLTISWLAMLYHAFSQLGWRPRGTRAVEDDDDPPLPPADGKQAEHGLLVIGLVAGAVWPWLLAEQPGGAFLLGALMVAGILGEALGGAYAGAEPSNSTSLSFVAGWATMAGCALFATLLQTQLGAPAHVAAVLGITIAALATVSIQLRLGRTISYGIAVIWGMIGLAAGSVATQAALSMMAVLGIAIIAVAMVRVTT